MTRALDVSRAGLAGVRLLFRRPLTAFLWGLLTLAPYALIVCLVLPRMTALAPDPTGPLDLERQWMAALQLQMLMGPLNLLVYAGTAVIGAAVMRAVLRPGAGDRFAFLRLGVTELLMLVVVVGLSFVLGVVMGGAALLVFGLAFGFGLLHPALGIIVGVIGGAALLIGLVWLVLRTSLIAPLVVASGRLDLVAAWRMTGGRVAPLLGAGVINLILSSGLGLALGLVLMGMVIFSGPHLEGLMRMMFPSSLEPLVVNWTVAGPLLALAGLVLTAMLAISQIAAWAPWADVCRQLTEAEPDPPAGTT